MNKLSIREEAHIKLAGKGRGFHGHKGVPGQRGGSAPRGGGGGTGIVGSLSNVSYTPGGATFTTSHERQAVGGQSQTVEMDWEVSIHEARIWGKKDPVREAVFIGKPRKGGKQQALNIREGRTDDKEVKAEVEGTATRMPIQLRTQPGFLDGVAEVAKSVLK